MALVDLQSFIAAIEAPGLREIISYWNGKRRGRPFPARSDIDPLEISADYWPTLALLEVHPSIDGGKRRYRVRRLGGWWRQTLKFEGTNLWLAEIPTVNLREAYQISFDQIVDNEAPLHVKRREIIDDTIIAYEAVLMPLATDQPDQVGMIFAVVQPVKLLR